MGRLKQDIPADLLAERARIGSKKYYWKNKERIDKVQREKYQIKKQLQNELRKDL